MKCFLICLILTFTLTITGCQKNEMNDSTISGADENDSNSECNVESTSLFGENEGMYEDDARIYNDIDQFLSEMARLQSEGNGLAQPNGGSGTYAACIPVLNSPHWELTSCVLFSNCNYHFYYVPVGYEKTWFDPSMGFLVMFSSASYDSEVQRYGLVSNNGKAYDAKGRRLYIEFEYGMIIVCVPKTIEDFSAEKIDEYFPMAGLDLKEHKNSFSLEFIQDDLSEPIGRNYKNKKLCSKLILDFLTDIQKYFLRK